MAGAKRALERRQMSLIDFPEEILLEILLLLPPKSILRCRAVCKALRRLATDHAFLLAHHHRQPAQRLVSFVRDVNHDLEILDYCVEALDFRTHEFRSVVRFTGEDYSCVVDEIPFVLHAVCDGLLLMSYQEILYICNPATRHWALVSPPTLPSDMVVGFYAHVPSGDYRVLYCKRYKLKSNKFFISDVGSNNQRHIISGLSSAPMRKWLPRGSAAEDIEGPTVSHGNLHWLPHTGRQRNILVFDTTNEIFRLLLAPVTIELAASLLEIDGMLAMSNSHVGESYVDLWLLQDYKLAVWVRKYRIELPVIEFRRFEEDDDCWSAQVVSREGDVLVDGFETVDWQFNYDRKGNLLKKFLCDGRLLTFTPHILRESLVPHAIFQNQQNRCTCEPPFFRGL